MLLFYLIKIVINLKIDYFYKKEIMENSVLIIGVVVFLVFFLILYFVKQNKKDKKELEKKLNNDYKKIDYSDQD